jgi:hypothetical protein
MEALNQNPYIGSEPANFHSNDNVKEKIIRVEIIKVVAARIFLELLSRCLAVGRSEFLAKEINLGVVKAPVIEEVLFRGCLVPCIYFTQRIYNRIMKKPKLTATDQRIQQIFRVHLSAFIFAIAHLLNPHATVASALIQVGAAYTAGVSYAYIYEKYQTLSITMLAHGIHNALAIFIEDIPGAHVPFLIVALVIHNIGCYVLGTTDADVYLAARARQGVECLKQVPRHVVNYFHVPHVSLN